MPALNFQKRTEITVYHVIRHVSDVCTYAHHTECFGYIVPCGISSLAILSALLVMVKPSQLISIEMDVSLFPPLPWVRRRRRRRRRRRTRLSPTVLLELESNHTWAVKKGLGEEGKVGNRSISLSHKCS